MKRIAVASFLLFIGISLLWAQDDQRKKPVLIRDDVTRDEPEVIVPDPEQAKKHVEVGDFYFRQDNFKAAEDRYREAIKYNIKWPEAYEKLVKALEKLDRWDAALEACRDFIQTNPSSKEVEEFRKRVSELESRVMN